MVSLLKVRLAIVRESSMAVAAALGLCRSLKNEPEPVVAERVGYVHVAAVEPLVLAGVLFDDLCEEK